MSQDIIADIIPVDAATFFACWPSDHVPDPDTGIPLKVVERLHAEIEVEDGWRASGFFLRLGDLSVEDRHG